MVGVEAPTPLPERSRWAEHEGSRCIRSCAHPTGIAHARTTDASEQRFNVVNLRETLEVG
jgi:hypothetical protein